VHSIKRKPPPEEGWWLIDWPLSEPRLEAEAPACPLRRHSDESQHYEAHKQHLAPKNIGRVLHAAAGVKQSFLAEDPGTAVQLVDDLLAEMMDVDDDGLAPDYTTLDAIRPEVVVEVTYLTWTEGGLLRAVSYQGQREDKPARQVVRSVPHPPKRKGTT
jgi:hypothetical protein